MQCKKISIQNFRNIRQAEVQFQPGVNILIGENAQGKTNLLESIYFSALTKSFRTPHETDVISFDEDFVRILLEFESNQRSETIQILFNKGKKKSVEYNHGKINRMNEIIGVFKIVLFSPEHLSLIKEGPGMRRNYLDIAISQLRPVYLSSFQRYNRILKQRNSLIKKVKENRKAVMETIEFWNEQLAKEAATITRYRSKYLERVREHVAFFFQEMTGENEIPEIRYNSSSKLKESDCFDFDKVKNSYLNLLSGNLEKELAAETTLYGIHRDDMDILLNGKFARLYASQGQQRSLALALKLAEGEIIREECGEYPVFLFDDVLSELDNQRKQYLVSKILGKQVILTTCEELDSFKEKDASVHFIHVKEGKFF